jgi:hypothetical protein
MTPYTMMQCNDNRILDAGSAWLAAIPMMRPSCSLCDLIWTDIEQPMSAEPDGLGGLFIIIMETDNVVSGVCNTCMEKHEDAVLGLCYEGFTREHPELEAKLVRSEHGTIQ